LTVPELFFEKKQLIPELQQLLISYQSPDKLKKQARYN